MQAESGGGGIHWGTKRRWSKPMCAAGVAPRQARQRGTYAPGGIRQKLSPIATGPIPSKRCGRILEKAFQSDKLIAFLWALINDAGRTVFLIRDNLRVHYSPPVKE